MVPNTRSLGSQHEDSGKHSPCLCSPAGCKSHPGFEVDPAPFPLDCPYPPPPCEIWSRCVCRRHLWKDPPMVLHHACDGSVAKPLSIIPGHSVVFAWLAAAPCSTLACIVANTCSWISKGRYVSLCSPHSLFRTVSHPWHLLNDTLALKRQIPHVAFPVGLGSC